MLCQIGLFYPPESQLFFTFCFWLSEEKNGGAVTITQSIMVIVLIKKKKKISVLVSAKCRSVKIQCLSAVLRSWVLSKATEASVILFVVPSALWNYFCHSARKSSFFPKPKCPNCLKQRQLSGVACQLPLFNGLINLIGYSCSSLLCNTLLYTMVYWGTVVQLEETVSTWMADVFLDLC